LGGHVPAYFWFEKFLHFCPTNVTTRHSGVPLLKPDEKFCPPSGTDQVAPDMLQSANRAKNFSSGF
jgi:hypothetical protein